MQHALIHRAGLDVTEPEPSTQAWRMNVTPQRALDLFSDGVHLFVVDDAGTTAWDIASRAKFSRFPGFSARSLNLARNTLVAFSDFAISELRLPSCGVNP